jgi:hypothetical protein
MFAQRCQEREAMLRKVLLLLVVLGAGVVPGSAQVLGTGVIPVTEVGPTAFNATITAIETTISAIEDVIQSAYMLLELTPLDDIALSADFLETMAQLQAIAEEGAVLIQDAEAAAADFEAIFGLGQADATPEALQLRLAATTEYIWQARRYAVRTQSLIHHISGAAAHVTRLIELVSALVGNMQGNQIQIQLLAQANQTLQTQTLQQAAEQRVKVFEGAQRDIMLRGWNVMQHNRWEGWPTTGEDGI